MPIEPDRLYHQLGYLIAEMPNLANQEWQLPLAQRWLGRAAALVEEGDNPLDAANFTSAVERLGSSLLNFGQPSAAQQISIVLYRALARAELQASPSSQGAFIPVGEAFSAFTALSKLLSVAGNTVMFVDPFADANLLTDFAVLVPVGVTTLILADANGRKPALAPAVRSWEQQYGSDRPLQVRLAPERSLHDRLIVIDESESWSLGQSFNALATRTPTSILRADSETALLKFQAHLQIWETATPI
ncbi:MAG: hypothetical protein AAGC84_01075 [Pseudomonas sp.]